MRFLKETLLLAFTVVGLNAYAQIAVNDNESTPEEVSIDVKVLNNDLGGLFDPIDPTTVDLDPSDLAQQTSVTQTAGTFTVNTSDGTITFVPVLNFVGTVTQPYTFTTQGGNRALGNGANLKITVTQVNDAPIAVDDAATTAEDTPVTFNLTANDTDVDGNSTIDKASVDLDPSTPARDASLNIPNVGTFSVNNNGDLTYTPFLNFFGPVNIHYVVKDNDGALSNPANISITVTSVNDAPVAVADTGGPTAEDTPVSFSISNNDTDVDGTVQPATIDLDPGTAGQQQTVTLSGTWTVNNAGVITYTPALNFSGSAAINYTINDDLGATSNSASVTVQVTAVNDAPVAADDTGTTPEETTLVINILANDTDSENGIKPSTVDLNPSSPGIQSSVTTTAGTWTANTTTGLVTFVPAVNFNGTATITYTVSDVDNAVSNVATVTITVTPVNDPPTAVGDNASGNENSAISVVVTANDSDIDGAIDVTTVDLNTTTAGIQQSRTTTEGSWVVDATGKVTFTPNQNFSGSAVLSYFVNDNGVPPPVLTSNSATITITVLNQNDPPVAVNDVLNINEDTPGSINILANDTDPDGNGTIVASTVDLDPNTPGRQTTIDVSGGTATVNNAGLLTFTPTNNFYGTTTVTYTVNDSGVPPPVRTSNVATVTINVAPVNDPPVANNDNTTADEGGSVSFNIIANDIDVDGTIVASSVDLDPATPGQQTTLTTSAGSWSVSSGVVTFTPLANFSGLATINYTVQDNSGAVSNVATITVDVNNINDPPSFNDIADQRTIRNGAPKTITITGISAGPGETENMAITATSNTSSLIPNPTVTYSSPAATAQLSFQPVANQTGTATITIQLIDSKPNIVTKTFKIEVVDVRFTSSPVTVAVEGEPYQYNVSITELTDPMSIAGAQIPDWATVTPVSNNTATLAGTPGAGSAASSTVILQIKDGATVVDEQTFTLQVNHRPVVSSFAINMEEDEQKAFTAAQFAAAYSDADGNALGAIQFTTVPKHGGIFLNNAPLAINTPVPAASIANVKYIPTANYFGKDTVYWMASDGLNFSAASAYINFEISPVNDAPIVTLEAGTDSIRYELSSGLDVTLTSAFVVRDDDGDEIASAEIGFRSENFDAKHDRLSFTPSSKITGSFNSAAGTLTLSGKASAEEYNTVIRSIKYTYFDFQEIDTGGKSVYFTLSDGKSLSTVQYRNIKLIYTFEDIRIPNAFTPNGDGSHDVWRIASKEGDELSQYDKAEVKIYDKRGKLLYEATGFAKPWDGRFNGELLPGDSYFYTIDLKYNKVLYKGAITILR